MHFVIFLFLYFLFLLIFLKHMHLFHELSIMFVILSFQYNYGNEQTYRCKADTLRWRLLWKARVISHTWRYPALSSPIWHPSNLWKREYLKQSTRSRGNYRVIRMYSKTYVCISFLLSRTRLKTSPGIVANLWIIKYLVFNAEYITYNRCDICDITHYSHEQHQINLIKNQSSHACHPCVVHFEILIPFAITIW